MIEYLEMTQENQIAIKEIKMQFQIRKNVPMPAAKGRGPRTNYPFLQMEIGDSIFVPGLTTKQMTGQLGFWKKSHNLNFAIEAGTEDRLNEAGETVAVEGVTVWIFLMV